MTKDSVAASAAPVPSRAARLRYPEPEKTQVRAPNVQPGQRLPNDHPLDLAGPPADGEDLAVRVISAAQQLSPPTPRPTYNDVLVVPNHSAVRSREGTRARRRTSTASMPAACAASSPSSLSS
jgi:hypothetical protein